MTLRQNGSTTNLLGIATPSCGSVSITRCNYILLSVKLLTSTNRVWTLKRMSEVFENLMTKSSPLSSRTNMIACSGFLPDFTEKLSECIYHSRPGIETLYLHLPGVHVEDNHLLPLRYSHQPKSALKSPTLQTDRVHNSRAYFSIPSPPRKNESTFDFLASDVVHPCYLVASSPW